MFQEVRPGSGFKPGDFVEEKLGRARWGGEEGTVEGLENGLA